nr:DUF1990 domain-containing protein [Motilibacter deserti]
MVLRAPTERSLVDLSEREAGRELTYEPVGLSLEPGPVPAGWNESVAEAELGRGDEAWEAARRGLDTWAAHRAAGITVAPPSPALEEGTVVAIAVRLRVAAIVATCRIVRVVDEPDCYGFAYGTLPLHPEQGEESFLVRRAADGNVTFRARSVARPVQPLARLAPPVARLLIAAYTRLYARGMRDYVRR